MTPAVHASQNIYDDPAVFDCYSTFPRSQHGLDTAKGGAPEWPVLKQMALGDSNDSSNQNSIERTMLRGSKVLDLGCGYGWFCRWVRDEVGAEEVVGIDISERMLARARNFGSTSFLFPPNSHLHAQEEKRKENETTIVRDEDTRIRYERGDLETIRLSDLSGGGEGVYDLIYSSLSFHYISDFGRLAKEISTVLKPGGKLVFSIEHPIFTAPREAEWRMLKKKGLDSGTSVEN
jgi:SAM-dependent methyltransferase